LILNLTILENSNIAALEYRYLDIVNWKD